MSNSIESRKNQYYKLTGNQSHSRRTERAVKLDYSNEKTAIDCGCGAGNEVAYLLSHGYKVHGFDSSKRAIEICKARYANNSQAVFSINTFEDFEYPACSLMTAYNSLYFSDKNCFSDTWSRISHSIRPNGIFCGDFLGLNDEWAQRRDIQINPLSSREINRFFDGFDILSIKEIDEVGKTANGHKKHWHIYSIVAKKQA